MNSYATEGRRAWRYQRGNHNPYISKNRQHNGQKKRYKRTNNDLENIMLKTKDQATQTPLKTGGELMCSGRVSSSCFTSGTRRVNLVTSLVISHEWGKDREVFTTSETYPWSFVTLIFHNSQPSHGGDLNTFEVMTSTSPRGTLGSVASLLAGTLYQGNPDRNHMKCSLYSTSGTRRSTLVYKMTWWEIIWMLANMKKNLTWHNLIAL